MNGLGNDLIREARRRRGLTQTDLAQLAGTTQSAIARLESGRTAPSFDAVLRLLRLLNLDLDVMLIERDDSDWIQAQRLLKLDTDERMVRHTETSEQMRAFRGDDAA